MHDEAAVAAVVVAYHSGPELIACVRGLLAQPEIGSVVVVDNGDDSPERGRVAELAAGEGRLRLDVTGENLGFGRAMNRGVRHSREPWLLLVNPDCEIPPHLVADLLAAAVGLPAAGAIGVRLIDRAGKPDPASARHDPTPLRAAGTALGLGACPVMTIYHLPVPQRRVEVDAVGGALLLLPRAAFEAVDGFDEGYFLHAEDLDLCRRLRGAGYRNYCLGEICVVHGKGGSSGRDPAAVLAHKQRSLLRYFEKFDAPRMSRPARACVRLAARLLFGLQRLGARLRRSG